MLTQVNEVKLNFQDRLEEVNQPEPTGWNDLIEESRQLLAQNKQRGIRLKRAIRTFQENLANGVPFPIVAESAEIGRVSREFTSENRQIKQHDIHPPPSSRNC